MTSRRPPGVLGRLLLAFGAVSVLAVMVFLVIEGLGVDAGLDAVAPAEEEISDRVHGFLYRWSLVSGAVALVLAIALAGWFTLIFVSPVRSLAASAAAFAQGDRHARCEVGGRVRELDELAQAFNVMADAVQAHEAARNQLLSDIAHELRSPLTVVTGRLEEMADGLVPADPAALAAVHAECQRLAATADDLARLSAEDRTVGPAVITPVDLGAVASQSVAVRSRAFWDVELRLLDAVDHISVCSDELRLRQILGNLLDNCYRYCGPGDLVRVSTVGGELVWLVVDDSGPGMAAEERRLATAHGYRGSATAGIPGTGTGLALVRQWADALGGHVALDQSPLGGLRVSVGLPACGSGDRKGRVAGSPLQVAPASPGPPSSRGG